MRRTSFAGAMVAIGIGAVLAFAVQGSPRDFDVQTAGLILIIAGAADLLIRSLVADSPLLSAQSAEVAAVVEPLGDPVLDAAGNPISVSNPALQARPPLVAPLPGTMPPGAAPDTIVVTDEYGAVRVPAAGAGAVDPTAVVFPGAVNPTVVDPAAGGSDYQSYAEAVRATSVDPLDTPEAPVAVTTLTGRPVRPRGRGLGGARRRVWRR
jgi:hypothetical protein